MSADKSQVMSETLNLKQLMDNPDEYVDNTKYIREVKAQREDLYRYLQDRETESRTVRVPQRVPGGVQG
jgi:hypothetical protein